MKNTTIENCAKCNQELRIPTDIGGMLMRCPECDHEFHTDFILSHTLPKTDMTEKTSPPQRSKPMPRSTFRIIV